MALMQNIRRFAETQLQGVIPWEKFSFPDDVKSDTAKVLIDGKNTMYRISVTSSYAHPPLGEVVFTDQRFDHEIRGDNQDGTWHEIAKYIKMAETVGDERGTAVEVVAPVESVPVNRVVPLPVAELAIPPVPLVWYVADPGVWYQNGPALVTRVNADGSYNLTVMPDGSEPFYRQNVRSRSDDLRNICWVPYPVAAPMVAAGPDLTDEEMAVLLAEPRHIVHVPNDQSAEIAELRTMVHELTERIGLLKASAFDQRKTA